MTETHKTPTTDQHDLRWKKSSWSPDTNCVEVAQRADGSILVRNSNHPDAGVLEFTPAEMAAWIAGCAAGEFDYLRPTA